MCDQDELPPATILDYVKKTTAVKRTSVPLRSIHPGPQPQDHTATRDLPSSEQPITSIYHLLISRIVKLKSGPFHEHSSQLYNIANGVKTWTKLNEGMRKMYDVSSRALLLEVIDADHLGFQAEVLGKRVVVQHIPLGGFLAWDPPEETSAIDTRSNASPAPSTSAPWTSSSAQSLPAQTGAPWATSAAPSPWSASVASTGPAHQMSAPWASANSTSVPPAMAAPWARKS